MAEPIHHSESRRSPLVILIVFGIVMAFLGYEMMQFKRAGKQVRPAEVTIYPAMIKVRPGQSQSFEARVVGIENTDAAWSVDEGAEGGTIASQPAATHDGRTFASAKYIAPAKPGVFHVTARSAADGTRNSTATVVVAEK